MGPFTAKIISILKKSQNLRQSGTNTTIKIIRKRSAVNDEK